MDNTYQSITGMIDNVALFTADEGLLGAAVAAGVEGFDSDDRLGNVMICVITLRNGFSVVGSTSLAADSVMTREQAEDRAYAAARSKIPGYVEFIDCDLYQQRLDAEDDDIILVPEGSMSYSDAMNRDAEECLF